MEIRQCVGPPIEKFNFHAALQLFDRHLVQTGERLLTLAGQNQIQSFLDQVFHPSMESDSVGLAKRMTRNYRTGQGTRHIGRSKTTIRGGSFDWDWLGKRQPGLE